MPDLARAVLRARDRAAGTPARSRVPVLLISSAAVYGRRGGPLREDASCAPESDYGRGKLAMERVAAAAGGAVHVLRLGNVAGGRRGPGGRRAGPDGAAGSLRGRRHPVARLYRSDRVGPGPGGAAAAGGGRGRDAGAAERRGGRRVEMAALLDAAGLAWTPPPRAGRGDPRGPARYRTARRAGAVAPPGRGPRGEWSPEWRRLAPTAPRVGGTPG